MKRCKRCSQEKSESEFSPYLKSRDGLFSWCKKCNRDLEKGRYARLTPEEKTARNRHRRGSAESQRKAHSKQVERYRTDPEYRKRVQLEMAAKYHGVTVEEYTRRRANPCAICGVFKVSEKRGSGMHIDHDHRTGTLRGTLCDRCNRGIGMFDDDASRLVAAAEYVRQWQREVTCTERD